jgi:hypothetical protein
VSDPRSAIPSVDGLLDVGGVRVLLLERYPRARVLDAARRSVAEVRSRIAAGRCDRGATSRLPRLTRRELSGCSWPGDVPSLRRVINATGVVLHTNLGRAPLAASAARRAIARGRARRTRTSSTTSSAASAARATMHCVDAPHASSPARRTRSSSTTTPPRSCSASTRSRRPRRRSSRAASSSRSAARSGCRRSWSARAARRGRHDEQDAPPGLRGRDGRRAPAAAPQGAPLELPHHGLHEEVPLEELAALGAAPAPWRSCIDLGSGAHGRRAERARA